MTRTHDTYMTPDDTIQNTQATNKSARMFEVMQGCG